MGMIESMIIGGIAGGVGAGLYLAMMARKRRKLAAAVRDSADPAAARVALDRMYPPKAKLGIYDILPMSTRFVALGALGDLAAISRESAAFPDKAKLTARVQVLGMGLLIRRLLGDSDPRVLPELVALQEEIERDGGALFALVKKQARVMVAAARTVDDEPLPEAERKALLSYQSAHPHGRAVWLLAVMHDRLARKETAGLAELNVAIEGEWPRSAYARRAEELLRRG